MFGSPRVASLNCRAPSTSSLTSFSSRIHSLSVVFLIVTMHCKPHHQVMETLGFHKTKPGVVDVDFKAWDIQLHGLHNIKVRVILAAYSDSVVCRPGEESACPPPYGSPRSQASHSGITLTGRLYSAKWINFQKNSKLPLTKMTKNLESNMTIPNF